MKNKSMVRKLLILYIAFVIFWNYRQYALLKEMWPMFLGYSVWGFIKINLENLVVIAGISAAVAVAGHYIRIHGKTREILSGEQKEVLQTIYKYANIVLWIIICGHFVHAFSLIWNRDADSGYTLSYFLFCCAPVLPWVAVQLAFTEICGMFSEKIDLDEEEKLTEISELEEEKLPKPIGVEDVQTIEAVQEGEDKQEEKNEQIIVTASEGEEKLATLAESVEVTKSDFAMYYFGKSELSIRNKYSGKVVPVWNEVCDFLAETGTLAEFQERMEQQAANCDYVGTTTTNDALVNKVIDNVGIQLNEHERVLFYVDAGVFGKGKEGVLVTTQRIYVIGKLKIHTEELSKISSLTRLPLNTSWDLNGNVDMTLGSVNATKSFNAMTVAYVVMLARTESGKVITVG